MSVSSSRRTSVFQTAERGCNSRRGYQIVLRRRAYATQLVQGSPSRFISADARVRSPQLRRLDGELALAPGRSASPRCPQGPGSIPTPSANASVAHILWKVRWRGATPVSSTGQPRGAGFDSYTFRRFCSGCSSGEERVFGEHEAAGAIPVIPTIVVGRWSSITEPLIRRSSALCP